MNSKDITTLKIGLLGGGQLGRMMIQSAINYNLDISVLDPDPNAPCAHLVESFTTGKLTDEEVVFDWGKDFDLITIEIENVSVNALKKLATKGVKIFPQPEIIELIQNKRKQKTFYKANRIPTADFILTENAEEVRSHQPGPLHFRRRNPADAGRRVRIRAIADGSHCARTDAR